MVSVTIVGGHGKVALLLAKLLTEKGIEVNSLIRDPLQSDDVSKTGANPVVYDIESADVDGLATKFKGADAIVFSAGAGGGDEVRTYAVDQDAAVRSIKAAEQAGVKRYVTVSFLGADKPPQVPKEDPFFAYWNAKHNADKFLKESSLDWTILQPGTLSTEQPSEKIEIDPKDTKGTVSRGNVALVAFYTIGAPTTVHRSIPFLDGATPIREAIGRF